MIRCCAVFAVLLGATGMYGQKVRALQSAPGKDAVRATQANDTFASEREVRASFQASFLQANRGARGEAWLEFSLESSDAPRDHVTVRIPISSTEAAYGESRSCSVGRDGHRDLIFTAGLDEPNFIDFQASSGTHDFSLLLNKYLCRTLAAPFSCAGQKVSLPKNWAKWKIARHADVRLSSSAPAAMRLSPVFLTQGSAPFNFARCAVEAPSEGLCCVQKRTTQWHCGGTPAGAGWHQVSGDCWHRETGASCKDGDLLVQPGP